MTANATAGGARITAGRAPRTLLELTMNQTDPTADFDGCRRACRQQGAHTLRQGECEHAPEPEPTVSLSRPYTGPDGVPGIAFDRYTVDQLAELLDPVLGSQAMRARTGSVDLAHLAAHTIVHRNDADAQIAALPAPQGPEYAPCRVCSHIEPEHEPNAGTCLVCDCAGYQLVEPSAWIDGDPLMEAIAHAVWEHCERSDSGLVVDDPRNIAAVAAAVARTARRHPVSPPTDRAALLDVAAQAIRDSNGTPEALAWWKQHPQLIPAHVYADAVLAVLGEQADRAAVCICGHTEAQHFEDVCITEITGCDCGDYVEPDTAREAIDRWRAAALKARAEGLTAAADFVRRLPLTRTLVTTASLEAELRRLAVEAHDTGTQQPACAECDHPKDAHRDGDDPVTPGLCHVCETEGADDFAHHDYQPATHGARAQQQPDTEARPAEHTWAAELYDPQSDEWAPTYTSHVRDRAVNALEHARTIGPTWKDGTPTRRRLVRATTTYTVEGPAPMAQQPAAEAHSCSNCEGVDPASCLMNPDRQQPVAADGEEARGEPPIVAYSNSQRPGVLLCRQHGEGWMGLTPLTSEDLPDGGICTWNVGDDKCGVDVLAKPERP